MLRAAGLFASAALAEIGGAYMVWRAVREGAPAWIGVLGSLALVAYGLIAARQADAHFGRVFGAYGGVFVAGSLLWGILADRFRPDRYDLAGAGLCLLGAAVIICAPR